MNLEWISYGVTRWVLLVGPFAIKFPKHIRGWMANQSEWRQRRREGVNSPICTLFHFVTLYWRAEMVGRWHTDECPFYADSNEERKGSSWGAVNGTWLLIDFDRAWRNPRSLVGGLYYGKQERLSRKWSKLPQRYEERMVTDG